MDSPDRLHSNEPTLDLKKFAKEAAAALTKDILEFVGKPHEFPPHESDVLTFELLHQVNVKLYKMGRDIPQERSSQFAITTIQYVIDALQKSNLPYFLYYQGLLSELASTHPGVPEKYTGRNQADLLREEAVLKAQQILSTDITAPRVLPTNTLQAAPNKDLSAISYENLASLVQHDKENVLRYLKTTNFEIQQGNEFYYEFLAWVQQHIEGLRIDEDINAFFVRVHAVLMAMLDGIKSEYGWKFNMPQLTEDFAGIAEKVFRKKTKIESQGKVRNSPSQNHATNTEDIFIPKMPFTGKTSHISDFLRHRNSNNH